MNTKLKLTVQRISAIGALIGFGEDELGRKTFVIIIPFLVFTFSRV